VAGFIHSLEFEVPVFRDEHADLLSLEAETFDRRCQVDSDSRRPKGARRESLSELLESFRGRIESLGSAGWEIRLPRAATPPLHNAVLFLGAIVAFTGGGLAMGGALGAGFAAMPWLGILTTAGWQRLRYDGERIEYQRTSFWGRRMVPLALTDIQHISRRQVSHSWAGAGVHEVTAELISGQKITLLANALSPLIAHRICRLLQARLTSGR
jgi:hypothetical protein